MRRFGGVGRTGGSATRVCFMYLEVIRNEAAAGCHRISWNGPSGSDQPLVDTGSGAHLVLNTLIGYGAALGR